MLRGVFSAMITPFDKNENVDEKGVETLINWSIGKGTTAFLWRRVRGSRGR